jgi:hypothetical protein
MPTQRSTGRSRLDRGNDYDAADAEVRSTVGDFPSVEDLLASRPDDHETKAAGMKRLNVEATEALDLSKIKPPEKGHTIRSAAVRGDRLVYVAVDETGRSYKGSEPYKG